MTPDEFKAWRKAMGLTQVTAAKALDLSTSTIEMYDSGKRKNDGSPVSIPRTVALACAALYHKLEPWGDR